MGRLIDVTVPLSPAVPARELARRELLLLGWDYRPSCLPLRIAGADGAPARVVLETP